MQKGLLIVTDLNGVISIKTVNEENWKVVFTALIEKEKTNILSSQDIEDILEDGVFEYNPGRVAAIIWLDYQGEYNCY